LLSQLLDPTDMSKKKGAAASQPPSRVRDLEEDVFDVAHNSLLRTAAELPRKPTQPVWEDEDDTPVRALTMGGGALQAHTEDSVRAAVQATWEKANELQEQAVTGAARSAVRQAREQCAKQQAEALYEQEIKLKHEAEEATKRLWVMAARERDAAIQKALEEQGTEVEALKQELARQKAKAAASLEEAYITLKDEARRDVEAQHVTDVNLAVQAAWESAGRLQDTAVVAARKQASAETQRELEEKFALERLKMGTEARRAVEASSESITQDALRDKEEITRLRRELEQMRDELAYERQAARDAEGKAASKQQQAVHEAMKAVQQINQANQERSAVRALAASHFQSTNHDGKGSSSGPVQIFLRVVGSKVMTSDQAAKLATATACRPSVASSTKARPTDAPMPSGGAFD